MLVIQNFVTVPPALSFIKPEPTINVSYQYGFLRCMFGFIIGMMIYPGYKEGFAKRFFASGTALVISAVCLCICLHFAVPDVISVSFYPLIILSAAYGSKNMNAVFGNKIMQRLGDWSFSIYLVHQPVAYTFFMLQTYFNSQQAAAADAGPPPKPEIITAWLVYLVFLTITLVLSWLTYKYVEVPSRNWINNKFKTCDAKSNLQTI